MPWIRTLIAFAASLPTRHPHLRLLGICFGHQILALAAGGVCEKSGAGYELGVRELALTPTGARLLADGAPTIRVHQVHGDHVPLPAPPGFELLASTSACANHGMVRYDPVDPSRVHTLTVQGHPEFDPFIVREIIAVREAKGAYSPELCAASRKYADEHDDGVALGLALLRATGLASARPAHSAGRGS